MTMVFTPSRILASFGHPLETVVSMPGVNATHFANIAHVCMYMWLPKGWSGFLPRNRTFVVGLSWPIADPPESNKHRRAPAFVKFTMPILHDEGFRWCILTLSPRH